MNTVGFGDLSRFGLTSVYLFHELCFCQLVSRAALRLYAGVISDQEVRPQLRMPLLDGFQERFSAFLKVPVHG